VHLTFSGAEKSLVLRSNTCSTHASFTNDLTHMRNLPNHTFRSSSHSSRLVPALIALAVIDVGAAQSMTTSTAVGGRTRGVSVQTEAQAQSGEDAGRSAESSSSSNSTMYYHTKGDRGEFELRVANGEVTLARINGQDVGPSRLRRVPEGWQFLDESGRVLDTAWMAAQSGTVRVQAGQSGGGWSDGRPPSGARGAAKAQASGGGSSSSSARSSAMGQSSSGKRSSSGSQSATSVGRSARDEARGTAPDGSEIRGEPVDAAPPPRAMIGAGLGTIDEALAHHLALDVQRVTLVTNVVAGLPAANAGVQRFDVIVGINGSNSASPKTLRGLLANAEPGTKFALKVRRGSDTKDVEVEAVAFDAEKLSAIEVEGMDLGAFGDVDALPGGFATVDVLGRERGDVMIFVGPDGEMRELRMPSIPSLPRMPGVEGLAGMSALDAADLERIVQEALRQMESWVKRGNDRPRSESDNAESAEQASRDAEERRAEGARRESENDRMRRLEEQMERLMRELEREREERRRAKPGSEA